MRRKLTRWWHGGAPGIEVGDRIVPANELPELPWTYRMKLPHGETYEGQPDRVFITPRRSQARFHAAAWAGGPGQGTGQGWVYNVRPEGELWPDPDAPASESMACRSAVVVAVVEQGVALTEDLMVAGLRHMTWEGGGPIYGPDGRMLPSPEMTAFGITEDDLRVLPRGFPVGPALNQFIARLLRSRGQTWTGDQPR